MIRARWIGRAQALALAWAVFALVPRAAHSNGPEVGLGAGALYPLDNRAIQLVSEVVDVRLGPYGSEPPASPNALCVYRLRNLADWPQQFTMAFVANAPISPGTPGGWGGLYRAFGFELWQDGVPRTVRLLPSRKGVFRQEYGAVADSFPAWDLTILPHRTSTVRMRYRTTWSGGCDGSECGADFTDHALPAARWSGRIEHAVFRLRLGDSALVRRLRRPGAPWRVDISPRGYQWTPDGIGWEFRDWEPDSNLRVAIGWPSFDGARDPSWFPWSPDSLAALPDTTTGLDRRPEPARTVVCDDGRDRPGSPPRDWPEQKVLLRVHVSEAGVVDQVRFPGPPDPVMGEASSCVRRWRFRPAEKSGRAVPAWRDVTVTCPAIRATPPGRPASPR